MPFAVNQSILYYSIDDMRTFRALEALFLTNGSNVQYFKNREASYA